MKTLRLFVPLLIMSLLFAVPASATDAECPLSYTLNAIAPITATPATPTVTPTGGTATTWAYKIVAKTVGGTSVAGSAGQTTAGVATLSVSAYNTITWTATALETDGYDIYRTTAAGTPSTTGKIGSIAHGAALSFVDTGLAGDGTSAPATNTSAEYVALIAAPGSTASSRIYIDNVSTANSAGSRKIRICSVHFEVNQTTTKADFGLVYGSGSACRTGTTKMTPLFLGTVSVIDRQALTFNGGALDAGPGKAVCLNLSGFTPTGAKVLVTYALKP